MAEVIIMEEMEVMVVGGEIINEYGQYCALHPGFNCHLESNCDFSHYAPIDHADCPEGWECCVGKEGIQEGPLPTPPPPNEGGPCEGGKLLKLCKNYSICVDYPDCLRNNKFWLEQNPDNPKGRCAIGDVMACPEACVHLCTKESKICE